MKPTPYKGTQLAATVFAVALSYGGPAFSQSFTIGNGQTAGQQTMNNAGDVGTVTSGGTIETFNAGENAVQMLNGGQRLTNSGEIETFGDNAWSVNSQGDDATVINNGLIAAFGINAWNVNSQGNDATVINNGSIYALAGGAIGIVSAGNNANVVNNGLIETYGDGTTGIISDGSNAYVENRGSIIVSGTLFGGAGGIVGDKPDLTVVNSGSIAAYGPAALGIAWQGSGLRVTNSGSITVTGPASTAISATGNDVIITNSGTVFNDFSESSSTAIFFGSSQATLNLLAGTAIQGSIFFSGSSNTVSFGPGLNAIMTFSGSGLPQTILTGGRPFVTSGNTVAVVDVTGFASAAPFVEDLTDAVAGVVEKRLTVPHDDVLGQRSGPDAWLAAFGGVRSQGASGAAAGFSQALGGIVAGVEKRSDDGFLGGVFVGAATGTTEVDDNAQDITQHGVFAGGYLGYDSGQHFANLSFTAGVLEERSSRRVANNLVLGGIETARADFNGTFISPALTLGTRLPVSLGTLIPSVRLRYAGLFLGGYTEEGSDADLTVERRNVHVFDVRGQLALAMPTVTTPTQAWQTTLRIGLDGIAQTGGDVSATLLGQDISFASGGQKTALRGFAGADVTAALGHAMTLDTGFEVGYGSDNAFTARGQVRLSKAF